MGLGLKWAVGEFGICPRIRHNITVDETGVDEMGTSPNNDVYQTDLVACGMAYAS